MNGSCKVRDRNPYFLIPIYTLHDELYLLELSEPLAMRTNSLYAFFLNFISLPFTSHAISIQFDLVGPNANAHCPFSQYQELVNSSSNLPDFSLRLRSSY
jgi:hypothetical protein